MAETIGIELTAGRIIEMRFGARTYTWTFRPLGREDWERFFKTFETETMQVVGESIETFEVETGLVELARENVVSVEGYKMPEGLALKDLRARLPHGHLRAFGVALRDVQPSKVKDEEIELGELHEVSLDCTWTRTPEVGGMMQWTGLVHRFKSPTLKEQRAFNRACNTHRVVGDDRGGKTIYPARQSLMMDFYDSLIQSVDEDYRYQGAQLVDRDQIIRVMDGSHKIAAVQAFLTAGGSGHLAGVDARRKRDDAE